jgi:hypothetical protein
LIINRKRLWRPVGEFAFSVLSITYKKVSQKLIPYDLKDLYRQLESDLASQTQQPNGRTPQTQDNVIDLEKRRGGKG